MIIKSHTDIFNKDNHEFFLQLISSFYFFKQQKHLFNNIRMSEKFSNILIYASLCHVYHMTKAVQVVEGTHCGL